MIPPKSTFTLLICLYFSQGLPSGLLAHTLPALMRSYGVGLEWISLLKLLALPWFLKFLWAPFIDQRWQRRYWIVLFQSIAIATLLLLSCLDPQAVFSHYLLPFLLLLLILNTCSASQDIASDGLAVQLLPARYLGLANSIQVAAYKLGLIGGGTALLIVIDAMGWRFSLQVFAGLLILALLPVFLGSHSRKPASLPLPDKSTMAFGAVFRGFIHERHMLLWLLLIATYKMADSLGSGMIKPMLVDYGYSLADIGYLASISSIGGIIGAVVGGFLFMRLNLPTALILFGALQTAGIGLLALIPTMIGSTIWVYGLSLFEQFSDGLSTVTLFAAMMMHCRKGLEGTDYTLQNSIALLGAGTAAMAGGFLAAEAGYSTLFMIAAASGVIPLVLILRYRTHITQHYR